MFLGTLGPSTDRRRRRQRAHPGLAVRSPTWPSCSSTACRQQNASVVPFTVWLRGPEGASLAAGQIDELDAAGSGIMWEDIDRDLSVFDRVVVRDAGRPRW